MDSSDVSDIVEEEEDKVNDHSLDDNASESNTSVSDQDEEQDEDEQDEDEDEDEEEEKDILHDKVYLKDKKNS